MVYIYIRYRYIYICINRIFVSNIHDPLKRDPLWFVTAPRWRGPPAVLCACQVWDVWEIFRSEDFGASLMEECVSEKIVVKYNFDVTIYKLIRSTKVVFLWVTIWITPSFSWSMLCMWWWMFCLLAWRHDCDSSTCSSTNLTWPTWPRLGSGPIFEDIDLL